MEAAPSLAQVDQVFIWEREAIVFATDKGLIRKDGKVIYAPVRTREE